MQVGCLAVLPSSWRDLQIFVLGVCVKLVYIVWMDDGLLPHVKVTKCVLSANVYTKSCMSIGWLERHCGYMFGFVRVARQLYMGKQLLNRWSVPLKNSKFLEAENNYPCAIFTQNSLISIIGYEFQYYASATCTENPPFTGTRVRHTIP